MEFFLVFVLGIAMAVVVLFILRPGFFTKPDQDFTYYEVMVEEALTELEERQQEILAEIELKQKALLDLQHKIVTTFAPEKVQSPKTMAVLSLAEEGFDVESIAKKMGLGIGEVELILELNKTKEPLAEKE